MEKLVSVIVPIYKVEKYLDQCIESIVDQTYDNLEIILVDDGSPDNCPKICDDWAKKDSRIKVIHKKNGGLSDARNFGLDICTGEYICFIDSDDYIKEDFVEYLYNNMKNNDVDISCCGAFLYYDNTNQTKKDENFNVEKKYTKIEAHKYMHIIGFFNFGMWNKMYKKELFNDVRFPVGKKSEDVYIMYKIIDKINYLYYSSEPKYYYRQREGSITNSSNNINLDVIEATNNELNFYSKNEYKEILPFVLQYYVFARIGIYNYYLCKNDNKVERRKMFLDVKKYRKRLTFKELPVFRKIQLFLFVYLNYIYNYVFKIYFLLRK